MIYSQFQNEKLPLLGFGAMRLPETDGKVDEAQVAKMVEHAMSHGVNYFDTAWPYHGGMSERVMGKVLSQYPRESFFLADKFPGHMLSQRYDPAAVFEEQLRRCGVEYFDFYLLHNVYERSIDVYLDPQWGILDYFREQKRLGRIRHLGFSTHGRIETMERFLDICGQDMEFCQIQLNYLDWTLQDAKDKYEMLTRRGIPVWVMEPVRGGKLATLKPEQEAGMKALRPAESPAAWCFRFLQGLPNVKLVLSGMSNLEQMLENTATFAQRKPLNDGELALVMDIAESMKNAIPCTACRYCTDGCPMGLDIPLFMSICSDLRFARSVNSTMIFDTLPQDKLPAACIGCGKCEKICPQKIAIPAVLQELTGVLSQMPKWADICRQRDEEQRRNRDK